MLGWPSREPITWRTLVGAFVLMCCGLGWFGIASLLGGWAKTAMLVLFGLFVGAVIVFAYRERADRLREEWRRGDGPDEFP